MTDELDPAEFVERIRQLGEQRDQQDAERVRKLEEEIIQGRSERLARRAERARSLSPDKPSTPQQNTPRSSVIETSKPPGEEKAAETLTPKMDPPSRQSAHEESLQRLTGSPAQTLEDLEPKKPAASAAALGRSGTLSWQRRPQSGIGSVRRPLSTGRPLSASVSSGSNVLASPRESQQPQAPSSPAPLSRTQIAESLGSKDPAWFKQTADRGAGSAAYRRNEDSTVSEAPPAVARRPLPGMSRESTAEPEITSPSPETSRPVSPLRGSSVRGSTVSANRFSTNLAAPGGLAEPPTLPPTNLGSPFQLSDSQKFAPPSEQESLIDGEDQTSSVRGLAMSPTQGRMSPERTDRPPSPTKGMGGFVQSAMLKRSDSVSKRWSAQTPQPSVNRQNSTMSNRNSVTIGQYGAFTKPERPSSLSRDNSAEPYSRPGSSASNFTVTQGIPENEASSHTEIARPALSRHSRSKSVASSFHEDNGAPSETPPSPSKRFSPTKSSWLESALNKPESPKPKLSAPQQPSWMAEINRKKQERGSVDFGKASPIQSAFAEPSGRISPIKDFQLRPASIRKTDLVLGENPLDTAQQSPKLNFPPSQPSWMAEIVRKKQERGSVDMGKGSPILSPPLEHAGRTSPVKDVQMEPARITKPLLSPMEEAADPIQTVKSKPALSTEQPAAEKQDIKQEEPVAAKEDIKQEESVKEVEDTKNTDETPEQPPVSAPIETEPAPTETKSFSAPVPKEPLPSPSIKAKPKTPPKKDFRAGLRPRQTTAPSDGANKNEVSELQNVFGRLRKAETKNYVAPDTLKDNILRGKSGLTITGGPEPRVRRDELKESLVTKKAAILAKAEETGSAALKKPETPTQPPTTPEALAKRKLLGRSDSISNVPSPKKPEPSVIPEALARRKSLRGVSRPSSPEKKSQPAPSLALKDPVKSSKLADRFNPALAGILARGPPAASTPSNAAADAHAGASMPKPAEQKTGPAPELTHMTKGRARGPKRRAPGAKQAAIDTSETASPAKVAPVATTPLVKDEPSPPIADITKPNEPSNEPSANATPARQSFTAKPATPVKSPDLSRKFSAEVKEPIKTTLPPSPEVTRKTPSPVLQRKEPIQQTLPPSPEVTRKTPSPVLQRKPSAEVKVTPTKQAQPPSPERPRKSPLLEFQRKTSTETKETPRKVSQTPSPEVPRKNPSLDLQSKVSAEIVEVPNRLARTESVESPKPFTPPPKTSSWRSSRPLPTPPPKDEPEREFAAPLQEIPAPNNGIPPVKEIGTPGRFSVKNATALWGSPSVSSPPAPVRARSPVKLPTRADEKKAEENAGLVRPDRTVQTTASAPQSSNTKPTGLGLGGLGNLGGFGGLVGARSRVSSPPKTLPDRALPASPPASGGRPNSDPFGGASKPDTPEHLLAQFFDEPPVTNGELPEHIDTMHILKTPPLDLGLGGKIRSLRKQIQEITDDGKLLNIPMQEEHVLFQDSMYLCTHVFSDSNGGKMTEVYLWSGNDVPEPTLEDAQMFARNMAKQNQAQLIVLRQGKETPNFFEALGGIVITKRGSRPGSHEYMLCGRRHLGHIAFDEVDFSLKVICSGFVYIVSTRSGRVFIWKGRGSNAEEISGARLIGMDLNLNGELVEVDEGSEPDEFFDVFPPAQVPALKGKISPIPRSASHWGYKATSDRYRCRLFKVEQHQESSSWGQGLQVSSFFAPLLRRPSWNSAERPQTPVTPRSPQPQVTTKVVEIMPFTQRDLEPEHIYVLDAFFEMYIIVGALSRAESAAFSTALLFAQDYSILAVSEEDRPLKPVTTIVLEGVPRDMKSVFRFWDDRLIPAAGLMRGKLGRGKSLRIMGLEKAIEATRR